MMGGFTITLSSRSGVSFPPIRVGKNKWKFFFNRGEDFEARDNYGIKYPSPFRVMNFSACASPWVPANRGMSGLDESTAFRLHALAGVPSPKTHHVHFRIVDEAEEAPGGNQYGGDLWGLYLSQEHPDGRFLNRVGLPDGNTYKIEGGNGDQKHQGPFESDYGAFVDPSQANSTCRMVGGEHEHEGLLRFPCHEPCGRKYRYP